MSISGTAKTLFVIDGDTYDVYRNQLFCINTGKFKKDGFRFTKKSLIFRNSSESSPYALETALPIAFSSLKLETENLLSHFVN